MCRPTYIIPDLFYKNEALYVLYVFNLGLGRMLSCTCRLRLRYETINSYDEMAWCSTTPVTIVINVKKFRLNHGLRTTNDTSKTSNIKRSDEICSVSFISMSQTIGLIANCACLKSTVHIIKVNYNSESHERSKQA
jgi:hypothetical protein